MFVSNVFRRIILFCIVSVFTTGLLNCVAVQLPVDIRSASLIRGNYSASDFVDGNVRIVNVRTNWNQMFIYFSNGRTLILEKKDYGHFYKGNNVVYAQYRGHYWHEPSVFSVAVEDVCQSTNSWDSMNSLFFIKMSMDITLRDCEKNILTFRCSNLLVQNDLDGGVSRVVSQGEGKESEATLGGPKGVRKK